MSAEDVVGLIRKVLGTGDVEIADNFFDVGGNSLAAIDLIALIKEATGVALPLYDLIRNPTAEGIARLVEARVR
jgi:acyl carrier protein